MTAEDIISGAENALPPYARGLGISADHIEGGMPVVAMPFGQRVEGRPTYLHGGATSGLLEIAGFAALRTHVAVEGRKVRLKPTSVTVQFLRGASSRTTYAVGRINRAGGRTANVSVEAWQLDRNAPVATAVMNFVIAAQD